MTSKKDKKITEISDRVDLVVKNAGETPNGFAKSLGYERSQTVYDIINGKSAPSYDFFNRFVNSEYSAIYSIEWLLTGKGVMLKRDEPAGSNHAAEAIFREMIQDKDKEIARLNMQIGRLEEKMKHVQSQPFRDEHKSGSILRADVPGRIIEDTETRRIPPTPISPPPMPLKKPPESLK